MDLSPNVLGNHAANQLRERITMPVLQIGKDRFTRKDLSGVECFNFVAAQNLSKILHDLEVKDTKDVFENVTPQDLALPRLGTVSIAVLGAAFQAKGLGGEMPLSAWVSNHTNKEHPDIATFSTIKQWAEQRQQLQKGEKETKRREQKHAWRRRETFRPRTRAGQRTNGARAH
jgi:hypothetical protein